MASHAELISKSNLGCTFSELDINKFIDYDKFITCLARHEYVHERGYATT
jgi:hypothetical protein